MDDQHLSNVRSDALQTLQNMEDLITFHFLNHEKYYHQFKYELHQLRRQIDSTTTWKDAILVTYDIAETIKKMGEEDIIRTEENHKKTLEMLQKVQNTK